MTKYKFNSFSRIAKSDKVPDSRYDWCIFLDEDKKKLNEIKHIKYTLHPTFSNPERIVSNRNEKFTLYSNGWGSFNILIEIIKTNGETIKTQYYLKLKENSWPIKNIEEMPVDTSLEKVYKTINESQFNWRKLSTIITKSKMISINVNDAIYKLEEMNLIRRSPYKSIDNQDLFGVTTKVGITPK
ncbi:MAG: hypothetical protein KAT68_05810 [Bacteroidales bacterium]|nr:hypothetical protein [Bacteroidales bacterium]